MRLTPALPALLALWILVGCAGGGAAPHRFYLVDPVDLEPLPGATGHPTVQVIDLEMPQYLERFQIATRDGPDRLRYAETSQWAENLRKNLLRTLGRNLGQLLDTVDVGTPLARTAAVPDFRLQLSLEAFERQADGHVRLAASWQVLAGTNGHGVHTHRADLRSPGTAAEGDYDAIVATMRSLFGELTRRIAESLLASGQTAA